MAKQPHQRGLKQDVRNGQVQEQSPLSLTLVFWIMEAFWFPFHLDEGSQGSVRGKKTSTRGNDSQSKPIPKSPQSHLSYKTSTSLRSEEPGCARSGQAAKGCGSLASASTSTQGTFHTGSSASLSSAGMPSSACFLCETPKLAWEDADAAVTEEVKENSSDCAHSSCLSAQAWGNNTFTNFAESSFMACGKIQQRGEGKTAENETKSTSTATRVCSMLQRTVQAVRDYCMFVLLFVLLGCNTVRYILVLSRQEGLTVTLAVKMVHFLISLEALCAYLGSSVGFRGNGKKLARCIRSYEHHFGYRNLDPTSLNTRMKPLIVIDIIILLVCSVIYVPVTHIVLDNATKQLTPFDDVKGGYFIAALVVYGCVFAAILFTPGGCLFSMAVLALITKREFVYVAQSLQDLFDRLPVLPPLNLVDDTSTKTSELCPNADHESAEGKESQTASAVDRKLMTVLQQERENAGKLLSSPRCEHAHSGPLPRDALDTQWETSSQNSSMDREIMLGPLPDQSDARTLEAEVDLLLLRHEAVCIVVEGCQECFSHVVAVVYSFSLLILCFYVFAYSSGSLPSNELPTISCGVFGVLFVHIAALLIGCSVHDSARAILRPIYNANKSSLSQTLLQKMQLTVQRLNTGEVGYHVYGLFVVSRPTILMLAGTILTYTVVVVQFQMGTCNCSPLAANMTMNV